MDLEVTQLVGDGLHERSETRLTYRRKRGGVRRPVRKGPRRSKARSTASSWCGCVITTNARVHRQTDR